MGWTGTSLSHKKDQDGVVSAVEDLANLEKQLSHSLEELPKRKTPSPNSSSLTPAIEDPSVKARSSLFLLLLQNKNKDRTLERTIIK